MLLEVPLFGSATTYSGHFHLLVPVISSHSHIYGCLTAMFFNPYVYGVFIETAPGTLELIMYIPTCSQWPCNSEIISHTLNGYALTSLNYHSFNEELEE